MNEASCDEIANQGEPIERNRPSCANTELLADSLLNQTEIVDGANNNQQIVANSQNNETVSVSGHTIQAETNEVVSETTFEAIFVDTNIETSLHVPGRQNSSSNDANVNEPVINSSLGQSQCAATSRNPIKIEGDMLIEPCSSNIGELDVLLDENEDEEETVRYVDDKDDDDDDEVIITINKKIGFAMPCKSNDQEMIKRENDVVSGNMPYNDSVRIILYFF